MDENSPEILVVFFDPRKTSFIILFQKAQDRFFELAWAFAGDDLDVFGVFFDGFAHDAVERVIDRAIAGKDGMEI